VLNDCNQLRLTVVVDVRDIPDFKFANAFYPTVQGKASLPMMLFHANDSFSPLHRFNSQDSHRVATRIAAD
jgi:hypothetical protein